MNDRDIQVSNFRFSADTARRRQESAWPTAALLNKGKGMDIREEPYRLHEGRVKITGRTDQLFLCNDKVRDDRATSNNYLITKGLRPRPRSAETNHARAAAFKLGNDYLITKRPHEAFQSYLRAAMLGHAGAQYNLGLMCLKGEGVLQDAFAGLNWIELAADDGDKEAQDLLQRIG